MPLAAQTLATKESPQSTVSIDNLPVEVILGVLEHLPTLHDLAAVVETCRAMHDIFYDNSAFLIRRILSQACDNVRNNPNPYGEVTQITENLEFAIRRQFLPRMHVEDAFTMAWPLFTEMHLEEILYPTARDLAWTYYLDGRPQEAMRFLKAIWRHESPYFLLSYRRRSPTLLPVARLLHDFFDDGIQRDQVAEDISQLAQLEKHLNAFIWVTNLTRGQISTLFFPPIICGFLPKQETIPSPL
ncbi:hypothetical protein ACJZ2D_016984 [Fusarium nematophilum]